MKKNILFISTDQQHWTAMGYLNPEVKTPNLDRLVASGTTFHRAYTPNPTCSPTRASWITGLYPSQHGVYSLGTKLDEDIPTIGDVFKEHGYRSALVGKAHFQPLKSTEEYTSLECYPVLHDLDFWRDFHGPFYGFDHVELARNHTNEGHAGQHYALWMEEKGCKDWRQYFDPTQKCFDEPEGFPTSTRTPNKPGDGLWEIPEELHYNTWIAERTNALMTEYKDAAQPFFLWASFFDPHPPYLIPEPYASMYDPDTVTVPEHTEGEFDDKPPYFKYALGEEPWPAEQFEEPDGNGIHGSGNQKRTREVRAKNMATMYGMMTMLDKYVGVILDRLDELGLTESTLVCFTSDHGDFLGQHGLTAKAIHHYEDILKIPLVVSQPNVIPAGRVSDSLQSTIDLPQTFLSMAGIPVPRNMTGIDESDVWTGKTETLRDHVLIENQHQPTTMNIRTLVTERYKLTVHYNQPYGELYDLQEDPGEMVNLWDHADHAEIKSGLLLKFIHGEMAKAPIPMPRIAGA